MRGLRSSCLRFLGQDVANASREEGDLLSQGAQISQRFLDIIGFRKPQVKWNLRLVYFNRSSVRAALEPLGGEGLHLAEKGGIDPYSSPLSNPVVVLEYILFLQSLQTSVCYGPTWGVNLKTGHVLHCAQRYISDNWREQCPCYYCALSQPYCSACFLDLRLHCRPCQDMFVLQQQRYYHGHLIPNPSTSKVKTTPKPQALNLNHKPQTLRPQS